MPDRKQFSVTFGAQYSQEEHPNSPALHPGGWLTVYAADEIEARALVLETLGTNWALLYSGEQPGRAADALIWYPRGRIAELTAESGLVIVQPEPLEDVLVKAIVATLQDPEGAGSDLPGEFDEDDEHFEVHEIGGFAGRLDVRHLANDIARVVRER